MFYKLVFWLTGGWIRRSVLVLVLIGASSYGSWMMIPPRTYLPPGNQNFVFSILSPPPGYSLDEYRSIAELVESRLRPWWEAKEGSRELAALQKQFRAQLDQFVIPGMEQQLKGQEAQLEKAQADLKSAPDAQLAALEQTVQQLQGQVEQTRQQVMMMKYLPPPSSIDNYFFVAYQGRLFMGASSGNEDNVAPLAMLMNTSIQGIPGTFGFAAQVPIFRLGRVTGSAIEVNVSGTNYDKVRAAAGILQGAMIQRFRAFATADPVNFALGRPELRVVANPVRAAAAGVSPQVVRQMVQVGVDGMILGDYRLNGQTIDLTVVAARAGRSTPEALRDVPVATGDGRVVPLSSVADFVNTSAAQEIVRLERQPSVSLGVQLPSGMTVQEGSRIVEEEVVAPLRAGGMIPPDVSTRLAGSADKLNEFMKAFVPGFALAAIVTYLLMAALFESFLHPLVIIMSVPFALVGGFLGLLVLNLTTGGALLDVLTMLGFVILIGVIINNPILIVHQALNYLREGMDRRRAIALSTQTRVRPIFMSVVTSVAGMAPLVVVGGAGSELYRGLGAVVVGGLLLSTIFTLFLTPTLMSLMLDLQGVLKRLLGLGAKGPPPLPHPQAPPPEGESSRRQTVEVR
jgi:HAE1 family hydrophobic/amphiphilic exporter-1